MNAVQQAFNCKESNNSLPRYHTSQHASRMTQPSQRKAKQLRCHALSGCCLLLLYTLVRMTSLQQRSQSKPTCTRLHNHNGDRTMPVSHRQHAVVSHILHSDPVCMCRQPNHQQPNGIGPEVKHCCHQVKLNYQFVSAISGCPNLLYAWR